MVTLSFPANPNTGAVYTFGTKTWVWTGLAWQLQTAGAINNVPIGNAIPNTGAFSTLSGAAITGGNLSITGNITGSNVSGGNIVLSANTISGPQQLTVTNPNVVISGNLLVTGTTTFNNTTNIVTNNLLLILANSAPTAAAANGAGLQVGNNFGTYATFLYNNAANVWASSLGISAVGNVTALNFTGGNVSATGTVTAASVAGGVITGSSASVTGSVTGNNIYTSGVVSASGNVRGSNFNTTGLVTATGNVIGGNITTVGDVIATGNITGNYLLANIAYATGYTASKIYNGTSEANIGTSGGNANISIGGTSNVVVISTAGEYVTGLLSATGNIVGGNISTVGQLSTVGNLTGGNLLINNNAVISGNLQVLGNVTFINSNVITTNDLAIELANNQSTYAAIDTAGVYVGNDGNGNPLTGWSYSYSSNAWLTNISVSTGANLLATNLKVFNTANISGDLNVTGNIVGANIIAYESLYGNGAGLSGINTFSNISITAGSSILANSIAETLTLTAGPGIAIVADAGNAAITISTASTGSSIFATGGDMGLVTDAVTASEDLGSVIDPYSIAYDLGGVIDASGLIYPSQLVLPTYTPGTLPSAVPAAQFVFLSTSSIGAMTAFSDGSNWRFTSSGNVVS